jgi:hypothetical protein
VDSKLYVVLRVVFMPRSRSRGVAAPQGNAHRRALKLVLSIIDRPQER